MPVTKGGADWRTRAESVAPRSRGLSLRQAIIIPIPMPTTKVKHMPAPIRKMVFQKRYTRMSKTGLELAKDRPQSSKNRFLR